MRTVKPLLPSADADTEELTVDVPDLSPSPGYWNIASDESDVKNDLVDEFWFIIHPLTLGKGKKLFVNGAIPAAFTLAEGTITPSGVIVANYKRAGKVKTGTIGA